MEEFLMDKNDPRIKRFQEAVDKKGIFEVAKEMAETTKLIQECIDLGLEKELEEILAKRNK